MKKFYKEHRVYSILMIIAAFCIILMLIMMLRYFYFGIGKPPKRTCADIKEGIRGDYIKKLEEDALVKDANIRVSDKSNVIFITINFEPNASLIEAQSKAAGSLESFDDEIKSCYDFEFTIINSGNDTNEAFKLMGAKNAVSGTVSWSRNNKISTTDN